MDKSSSKAMTFFLSFLVSMLLWAYATSDGDNMAYTRIEDIPISISNTNTLDQNDFVVTLSKEKIESIRLYGKGSLIKGLSNESIQASVDLKDISSEGTYSINISIKGIPDGVTVVDQNPNMIKVKVDKKGTKDISVPIIKQVGEIKEGYSVLSLSSNVNNVHISGPSDSVDKVSAIVGEVNVDNRSEDFTSNVNLYAVDKYDNRIDDVELNPMTSSVDVSIGKTKEVSVNVKTTGKLKDGYNITDLVPSKNTVVISAAEDVLSKISSIDTEKINLSSISSSTTKTVSLKIPEGVNVVDSKGTIDVSIYLDKENEKTVFITSFTFDNIEDGLSAEVLDDKISVLLSGDNELLDKINEKNLVGSLDLSGLDEGTHVVSIKISTQELPEGVSIRSVSRSTVNVKIIKEQE